MTTTVHHVAFRCQSKKDSGHPNPHVAELHEIDERAVDHQVTSNQGGILGKVSEGDEMEWP